VSGDMDDQQRVQVETIKLLVQVAWADHEIAPEEVTFIIEAAKSANVSAHDVATLGEWLDDRMTLPPPDLGFLRKHSRQVIAAVSQLITIDDRIVKDELDALNQIRTLLEQDD
jgi:hypothetical protein